MEKQKNKLETKQEIIKNFKISDKDTGSLEVQIALLTNRINKLNEHFKVNKKDFGSKRGLLCLVGQRSRFLSYVEKHNHSKYKELLERLNLRK